MKALFALLLMALPMASCSTSAKSPIAIYGGEWNADDSRIEGLLHLDEDCLILTDDAGTEWVVAFARGTTWNLGTKEVKYPGQTLRVNDRVAVGGSSPPGYQADWVHPPEKGCGQRAVWFVSKSP